MSGKRRLKSSEVFRQENYPYEIREIVLREASLEGDLFTVLRHTREEGYVVKDLVLVNFSMGAPDENIPEEAVLVVKESDLGIVVKSGLKHNAVSGETFSFYRFYESGCWGYL